jgi:hypothetical protein
MTMIWLFAGLIITNAQNKSLASEIIGYISEANKFNDIPIGFAPVSLITAKDTISTLTNQNGKFIFKKVNAGKAKLKVSVLNYEPYECVYDFGTGENMIFIRLKKSNEQIKAAIVKAEVPLAKQSGDTTIYYKAAISTQEGDDAMRIIEQLPGFSIRNGKILNKGKEIKRTYVNGVLIFGDNPEDAMNTIPASDVISIKAYEEKGLAAEKQGLANAPKESVLDVITKNHIVTATDIHALASGGTDDVKDSDGNLQKRYAGGVTGNFFSEMLLFHTNIYANNINRKSNNLNDITSANQGGLHNYDETVHAGTGFKKYWKDRRLGDRMEFNYSYDRDYSKSYSHSLTDYLKTESNPEMTYADTTSGKSVINTHSVSFSLNLTDTPVKDISFSSSFNHSSSDNSSLSGLSNDKGNGNIISQHETGSSYDKNWQYNGSFFWRDNIPDKKLSLYAVGIADLGRSDSNSWTTDTLTSSFYRRNLESGKIGKSTKYDTSMELEYFIRNSSDMTLSLFGKYEFVYDNHKNVKTAVDYLNPEEPSIDSTNTFDYTWNLHKHSVSEEITLFTKNQHFYVGTNFIYAEQNDNERVPGTGAYDYDFKAILPSVSYEYKNIFSLDFRTDSGIPSLEQLRNWTDNTNPLIIRKGNPDLKNSYNTYLDIKWHTSKIKGNGINFFSTSLKYSSVYNNIIASNEYKEDGSIVYSYANAGGTSNLSLENSYSRRFMKLKTTISFKLTGCYNKLPMYNAGVLNMLHEPSVALGMESHTGTKKINMYVNSRTSYIHSRSSSGITVMNAITEDLFLSLKGSFLKNGFAALGYGYNLHHYFSQSDNNAYTNNLNALIGVKLMKKRLTLSISGHDLLNQGSLYSITSSATSIQQSWTPSYGRYFMLNLSFRFNKMNSTSFMGNLDEG